MRMETLIEVLQYFFPLVPLNAVPSKECAHYLSLTSDFLLPKEMSYTSDTRLCKETTGDVSSFSSRLEVNE